MLTFPTGCIQYSCDRYLLVMAEWKSLWAHFPAKSYRSQEFHHYRMYWRLYSLLRSRTKNSHRVEFCALETMGPKFTFCRHNPLFTLTCQATNQPTNQPGHNDVCVVYRGIRSNLQDMQTCTGRDCICVDAVCACVCVCDCVCACMCTMSHIAYISPQNNLHL